MKKLTIDHFMLAVLFITIHLGLTQFDVIPSTQVIAEGEMSLFECQHPNADIISWNINQTTFSSYNNPDLVSYTIGHLYILRITARSVYNGSTVECVALFFNGTRQYSPSVSLQIQGVLNAVESLHVNISNLSISIAWEAPFTLNLTKTEPDITYCVELVNVSNGLSIFSVCNISQTELFYTFEDNGLCYSSDFNVSVTPINEAGIGAPKQTLFHYYYSDEVSIKTEIINLGAGRMQLRLLTETLTIMQICNCQLFLWNETTQFKFSASNGLQCNTTISMLNFSSNTLPLNSHYEGGFFIVKSIISIHISTYDVQSVKIHGSVENVLHMGVNYIKNTKAKGAFVNLVPVFPSDAHNIPTSIAVIIPYSLHSMKITQIPNGLYKVFVYDIEEDGLLATPLIKPAAISSVVVSGTISVSNSTNDHINPEKEIITVDVFDSNPALTINFKCTPSHNDSCMVIIRSSNNPEVLNVKILRRETSNPLVYSARAKTNYTITVILVNSDILNYTVYSTNAIVGVDGATMTYTVTSVYTIASGTALAISGMIIAILILIIVLKAGPCLTCKNQNELKEQAKGFEMQSCEAYEILPIQRQRVDNNIIM